MNNGLENLTNNFSVNFSQEIGKGNFGTVYRGYSNKDLKVIAVKQMDRKNDREIKVMLELEQLNHPNIMKYYGYEEKKRKVGNQETLFVYFFLEYCSKGSIKNLIKKNISDLQVLKLFKQLLQGMVHINRQKKVHRDLKPDNILLDENDDLKIADFGLSREVGMDMTKMACTPIYAAPEVLLGKSYDCKCDVWSAGLILYSLLIGEQMFTSIKSKYRLIQQVKKFQNPNHIKFPKNVHPLWQTVLRTMLTYNQNFRPSFEQVLEKVKQIQPFLTQKTVKNKIYSDLQSNQEHRSRIKAIQKQNNQICTLQNVSNFLIFLKHKTDFMKRLTTEFVYNPYPKIQNVYKYLLMFLSTSAYICKVSSHLNQLNKSYIQINDKIYQQSDFISHQESFTAKISQYLYTFTKEFQKSKKILETQILAKISKKYMLRKEEGDIIKKFQAVYMLIKNAEERIYFKQKNYMDAYQLVIKDDQVHFPQQMLIQFSQNDLRIYCVIRMIGNLDKIFNDQLYKGAEYFQKFIGDFQKMSVTQLLSYLSKYNNN